MPVVAALERSQATVKEQAETIGRQSAELERAASTIVTLNATLEARTAPQSTEPADKTVTAVAALVGDPGGRSRGARARRGAAGVAALTAGG